MISNGTVYFTFFSIIIFFITYKLTPFLNHKPDYSMKNKTWLSNPSVLDNLINSSHKYEISDCFTSNVQCKSDDECRLVCTENLPWYCDKICKLPDKGEDVLCENGVIKTTYDFDTKEYKTLCICKSPLYYGPSCSNTVAHCDTVRDNKCLCHSDNVNFLWFIEGGSYDICIPKTDYTLFSSQDNFKPV